MRTYESSQSRNQILTNQRTNKRVSSLAKTAAFVLKINHNPTVTREGREVLSVKLHSEIDTEKELDKSFRSRQKPVRASERGEDSAKIFNDFCVDFIARSKDEKDHVNSVLYDTQTRASELASIRQHLEELERQTYRFEMCLPNPEAIPAAKQPANTTFSLKETPPEIENEKPDTIEYDIDPLPVAKNPLSASQITMLS